jgi:hypothetical protein
MGFLDSVRKTASAMVRFVAGRNSSLAKAFRRPPAPLADRLLADAVLLSELPSPTEREERRAAFVIERLTALGLLAEADEAGNVFARIPAGSPPDARVLLLFADLGTTRWNPLGSLSRVDLDTASGAGLSDALGAAALLSIAEAASDGSLKRSRDLLLLFAARSLDDPRSDVFARLSEKTRDRPIAAIGLRGFSLGSVPGRPVGTYRVSVHVRTASDSGTELRSAQGEPPSAVDAAVAVARRLSGVKWDAEGATVCKIRRIEAGTGFGRAPTEGVVDIELESADAAVLDLAKKAAIATAETAGRESGAATQVAIIGHIPVGDPRVSAALASLVKDLMKEQKIKVKGEMGADPAAFLSVRGIPAVSIGIALGREGLDADEIEIASIETGRRLVAALTERASAGAFS